MLQSMLRAALSSMTWWLLAAALSGAIAWWRHAGRPRAKPTSAAFGWRAGSAIFGCAQEFDRGAPHRTLLDFATQDQDASSLLSIGFGVLRGPLVLVSEPGVAVGLLRLDGASARSSKVRGFLRRARTFLLA